MRIGRAGVSTVPDWPTPVVAPCVSCTAHRTGFIDVPWIRDLSADDHAVPGRRLQSSRVSAPRTVKARGMLPIGRAARTSSAVALHDECTLTIDSLSNRGDGVGRLAGQAVFVPSTAPGDRVRVRIVAMKKRHLQGRLLEVLSPGPDRVTAPCRHAGRCGGCDWQQVAYPAQLEAKRTQLRDTLQRVGGLDLNNVTLEPIVACEPPLQYRNRLQGDVYDGRFHLHAHLDREPIAITRCEIADERLNDALADGPPDGSGGRVELALVEGVPVWRDADGSHGFRQVNDAMAEVLESCVLDAVAGTSDGVVLDLYCGAGHWTCRLAERYPARDVIGIESDAANVREAERRRRRLGATTLRFVHGRVEARLGALSLADATVIVDPPRAGLDARVADRLAQAGLERLIYVSCHPATLARDLAVLTTGELRLRRVRAIDMFPQTAHVEACAILERA